MALGNWMMVLRRYWWAGLAALLLAAAACSSATPTAQDADTVQGSAASATAATTPASAGETDTAASPSVTVTPANTSPPRTATAPPSTAASPALPDDPTELMRATLSGNVAAIARKMVVSGDQSYLPVLIEFLRFQTNSEAIHSMASFLNQILDGPDAVIIPPERVGWSWWIEWLAENPQVQPPQGFAGWKGELYSKIDRGLGGFLYNGINTTIKLEEIVWGGVGKDGIPDLTNPPVVPASDAAYLGPDDRVFGVSINGEHRAYPLRILNPHEMANDVLGGVHFALAY